jgi:hypothetical protein
MVLIIFAVLSLVSGTSVYPEQVHIAWAETSTTMRVTWVTRLDYTTQYVAYRPVGTCADASDSWTYVEAKSSEFAAGVENKTNIQYYYVADMTNLKDFCGYEYAVGKYVFYSDKYIFYTRT